MPDQSASILPGVRDPIGLCATCRHARVVQSSRGSTFYRCRLAETDSRFAKYPRLSGLGGRRRRDGRHRGRPGRGRRPSAAPVGRHRIRRDQQRHVIVRAGVGDELADADRLESIRARLREGRGDKPGQE